MSVALISSGAGKVRVSELLNSMTSHHSLKWPRASREFWAALSQHSLLYLAFSNLRLKPLKLFEFLKCFFISETNIYSHSITAVSFHSLSKLWVCFHWCVSFKWTFIDLRRVRFFDMPLKPVSPAVTIGVVVGAYVLHSGLRALNVLFGNYCPKQCCCIGLWCNGPFCWLLSAFLLSDWAFGGSFKWRMIALENTGVFVSQTSPLSEWWRPATDTYGLFLVFYYCSYMT